MWTDLILSYQKAHGRSQINTSTDAQCELFFNKAIQRQLSGEAIKTILDELVKQGYGEWQDENKVVCSTSDRSLDDWAQVVYKWAAETGQEKSICTVYELTEGDLTAGEEFVGLDIALMVRVLKRLEEAGKVTLIPGDAASEMGVKFR